MEWVYSFNPLARMGPKCDKLSNLTLYQRSTSFTNINKDRFIDLMSTNTDQYTSYTCILQVHPYVSKCIHVPND